MPRGAATKTLPTAETQDGEDARGDGEPDDGSHEAAAALVSSPRPPKTVSIRDNEATKEDSLYLAACRRYPSR